ncbi:MAG: glutamyl-tRNA reductase, partial [Deltaproteobacteria bacterium]
MEGNSLILLGVNHKTTPVEIREKMAAGSDYEKSLGLLQDTPGVREYYFLSTCNRVELLMVAPPDEGVYDEVLRRLFGEVLSVNQCRKYLYIYQDLEAVEHLFRVAASLDSMVVGEAQILGQLKEAYRSATKFGCTGPLLNRLLHKSFSAAKRVRNETGIGSSAVSISYAAVQLAKKIFGSLKEKKVLLVGAGEMAELAAEHLLGQGVEKVSVVNRTLARAVELARRFNGEAVSFEELTHQLEQVDIVISSTGASGLVIKKEQVKPLMKTRMNRPLFLIDIAVPRDLDPRLIDLENVFLYDIDDLDGMVAMNKSSREQEAVRAQRIVKEAALKFMQWYEGLSLTPTIIALREKIDSICRTELEKTAAKLEGLTEADKKALERMAASISAKILYHPFQYLKSGSTSHRDKGDK